MDILASGAESVRVSASASESVSVWERDRDSVRSRSRGSSWLMKELRETIRQAGV